MRDKTDSLEWRLDMMKAMRMLLQESLRDGTAINILISEIAELKGTDSSEIQKRIDDRLEASGLIRSEEDGNEALRRLLVSFEGDGTIH